MSPGNNWRLAVRNVRFNVKLSFPCHPSEWSHSGIDVTPETIYAVIFISMQLTL